MSQNARHNITRPRHALSSLGRLIANTLSCVHGTRYIGRTGVDGQLSSSRGEQALRIDAFLTSDATMKRHGWMDGWMERKSSMRELPVLSNVPADRRRRRRGLRNTLAAGFRHRRLLVPRCTLSESHEWSIGRCWSRLQRRVRGP